MNGICKIMDCHYGAIPADDCNSSWIAVKVDRAGNQETIDSGFETEEEAEDVAADQHRQDLIDSGQFGVGA